MLGISWLAERVLASLGLFACNWIFALHTRRHVSSIQVNSDGHLAAKQQHNNRGTVYQGLILRPSRIPEKSGRKSNKRK
jgi:hypothetical protein